jgi:predicted DNA-binding transcriptional regulator AlpA
MENSVRYINEKVVAEKTGYSLATLRNWRHLGKGPNYVKVGKSVRYPLKDLVEFMESHKIKTGN